MQPKDNAYIYFAFKGAWWQGLNNLLEAPVILMLSNMIFLFHLTTTYFFTEFKVDVHIDCRYTVI